MASQGVQSPVDVPDRKALSDQIGQLTSALPKSKWILSIIESYYLQYINIFITIQ